MVSKPLCNCKHTACICNNVSYYYPYYPEYPKQPKPEPTYNFGNRYGWICPTCGNSYAPWMYKCDNCPKTYSTTSTDEGERYCLVLVKVVN